MAEGSLRSCIITLMSAAIGSGALLLPYGFRLVGLPGGILALLLGVYCTAQSLRLTMTIAHVTGSNTYSAGVAAVLGPGAGAALASLMCGVSLCAMASHMMFLVDVAQSLAPEFCGKMSRAQLMVLWAVLVSPPCLLRDISSLRHFAPIAPLSLVAVTALVVGQAWRVATSPVSLVKVAGMVEAAKNNHVLRFGDGGVWGAPRAWSIVVNALICHHVAVPVLRGLRCAEAPRVNKVVVRAVSCVALFYGIIGVCGFLTFGVATPENILTAFPAGSAAAILARVLVGSSLLVGIPLNVHAARGQVLELFPTKMAVVMNRPGGLGHVFFTALLLAIPAAVALVFPSVTLVVNIACGLGMVLYMFVVPALTVCVLRWQGRRGSSCRSGRWINDKFIHGEFPASPSEQSNLAELMMSSPLSSPLLSPNHGLVYLRPNPKQPDKAAVGSGPSDQVEIGLRHNDSNSSLGSLLSVPCAEDREATLCNEQQRQQQVLQRAASRLAQALEADGDVRNSSRDGRDPASSPLSFRVSSRKSTKMDPDAEAEPEVVLAWSPRFVVVLIALAAGTVLGFAAAGWSALQLLSS